MRLLQVELDALAKLFDCDISRLKKMHKSLHQRFAKNPQLREYIKLLREYKVE